MQKWWKCKRLKNNEDWSYQMAAVCFGSGLTGRSHDWLIKVWMNSLWKCIVVQSLCIRYKPKQSMFLTLTLYFKFFNGSSCAGPLPLLIMLVFLVLRGESKTWRETNMKRDPEWRTSACLWLQQKSWVGKSTILSKLDGLVCFYLVGSEINIVIEVFNVKCYYKITFAWEKLYLDWPCWVL